jgi:hypothetical protein
MKRPPHILSRSLLVFFLAVMLAAEGFLVSDLLAGQSSQNFLAAVVPGEIIALTNSARADNNVGQLAENKLLDAAAQAKASDMAAKGYFSHVGPDGKQPWAWIDESGYDYQYAGENLAVRFVDSSDVMKAWMASPSHHANIVKPVYTDIGVGVANGMFQGQPATFVVQYFGTPDLAVAPPPVPQKAVVQAAPTTTAPAGRVLGAETSKPVAMQQSSSLLQTITRQFSRVASEPRSTSNFILAGVLALLLIAMWFAFFFHRHVHVQPMELFMGASLLAGLALLLIVCNTDILSPALTATDQSASAALSLSPEGVIIDDSGASIAATSSTAAGVWKY